MNQTQYLALRSAARDAERRAELFEQQSSTFPHGDMSRTDSERYDALFADAKAAADRIPGGLTHRAGIRFCLYHEWQARRNRVRNRVIAKRASMQRYIAQLAEDQVAESGA